MHKSEFCFIWILNQPTLILFAIRERAVRRPGRVRIPLGEGKFLRCSLLLSVNGQTSEHFSNEILIYVDYTLAWMLTRDNLQSEDRLILKAVVVPDLDDDEGQTDNKKRVDVRTGGAGEDGRVRVRIPAKDKK